ncbi:MAG: Rieske (2Fe-2S) protein [Spirochaetaceae bacterium]|nr:Rieske (2Fe-2S) protein [Spirochaetaceae bacterium]
MNQEDAKNANAPQTPDSAGGEQQPATDKPAAAKPAGPAAAGTAKPAAAGKPAASGGAKPAPAGEGRERPAAARGAAAGARAGGARAGGARAARAAAGAGAPSTAAVSAVGRGAAAAAGEVSRRGFLSWISAGWLAFGALTTGTLIGTVRFLFPNVLFEPPQTFRAGFPEEYTIGDVSTRFKDQFAVWIVRTPTEIYVLSTVCTHLGCTPNWLSGEQKFKCPCHGSGFRKTGINFEGPAPRPLERYRVALSDDGQILVDKTRKYQWEKGEWTDPESFLAV